MYLRKTKFCKYANFFDGLYPFPYVKGFPKS